MKAKEPIVCVADDGRNPEGGEFKIPVSKVLKGAQDAGLTRVLVVGVGRNGKLYVAGSSGANRHLGDIAEFQAKLDGGFYDATPEEVAA